MSVQLTIENWIIKASQEIICAEPWSIFSSLGQDIIIKISHQTQENLKKKKTHTTAAKMTLFKFNLPLKHSSESGEIMR